MLIKNEFVYFTDNPFCIFDIHKNQNFLLKIPHTKKSN